MKYGTPSQEDRNHLAAMLDDFVIDMSVAPTLQKFDSVSISPEWGKAIARCETDPSGAITAARALLESFLKHLLEACSVTYETGDDLPKLYYRLSEELLIAPRQHSESVFKQIFGGGFSVMNGITALRNQLPLLC